MSKTDRSKQLAAKVRAIRSEYAEEEAEAAEAEIAEHSAALKVPLNLRIDRDLDAKLKRQAATAQIPTSALVRRLLRQAMQNADAAVLTVDQVEAIARRVVAESSKS